MAKFLKLDEAFGDTTTSANSVLATASSDFENADISLRALREMTLDDVVSYFESTLRASVFGDRDLGALVTHAAPAATPHRRATRVVAACRVPCTRARVLACVYALEMVGLLGVLLQETLARERTLEIHLIAAVAIA